MPRENRLTPGPITYKAQCSMIIVTRRHLEGTISFANLKLLFVEHNIYMYVYFCLSCINECLVEFEHFLELN